MLDEAGVVKVLDFGIARVLKGDSTATRHLAGTLRYMSPEQVSGGRLDRRSDVFSLGCSLFELVAYTPAFDGSAHEIIMRLTAALFQAFSMSCPTSILVSPHCPAGYGSRSDRSLR